MTDLRAAVLARLADLLATCDAATSGPWESVGGTHFADVIDSHGQHVLSSDTLNEAYTWPNARYVIEHNPSVMRPVWEALATAVTEHWYRPQGAYDYCAACHSMRPRPEACRFVVSLAAALGVSPEVAE